MYVTNYSRKSKLMEWVIYQNHNNYDLITQAALKSVFPAKP
jgi:hypothetical protein